MSNRHASPGQGTVYRRPDGRWCAIVSEGGGKRKYLYAATEREVRRKLNLRLRDQAGGLPPTDDRLTVAGFLTRWLEEVVKPSVRPLTYRSYERVCRVHLIRELGHLRLSKLAPADVQGLMARKLAEGLAPRHVAYIRVVLRVALGRAVKWGDLNRNVAALTDPPKTRRFEIAPLGADEARTFLAATATDRLHALYVLALTTGLREGELLGLTWADTDLQRRQARVRQQLQRVDGKLALVEPKTSATRRMVMLTAMATEALTSHRERQLFERRAAGEGWTETGLMFTSKLGTPLEPRNAVRSFKAALRAAGLPNRRFHDLRHSCASLLLAEGVPLKVVAEILGHASIRLTADTYSHVVPALQADAAGRLDALFAPTRPALEVPGS